VEVRAHDVATRVELESIIESSKSYFSFERLDPGGGSTWVSSVQRAPPYHEAKRRGAVGERAVLDVDSFWGIGARAPHVLAGDLVVAAQVEIESKI
jgi:hypothetical protein